MNSGEKAYQETDLRQQVFDLIYNEPDLTKGIDAALACVGTAFGISRVYIFENDDTNTHSSNTFEWCAPGIMPQRDELQNMSLTEYDYQSMFDENGLVFCPDVNVLPDKLKELLKSQSICAMLQYAIYDKGSFRGFVGFDDCVSTRPEWQDDRSNLDMLIYISRLLSICLLKERNLQNVLRLHAELEKSLQLEKEMREAATQAAESKSSFLSRMSHDMRTPMNGILGLAALSEDETDPIVLKQNMSKIRTSGKYLLGLINDILDSQKIESGRFRLNPEIVDGALFTDDMLSMVRSFAEEKHITFRTQMEKAELEGFVRLDPIRTKQICLNLLSNAIKFTPEHGTVTFQIVCTDLSPQLRRVVIRVEDTGVGMSEDFLQNGIYKPFSQEYNALSAQNISTGLGLSIVKRLVTLMNGTIDVKSELGKGTVFTVVLQLERVHQVAAAKIVSDDVKRKQSFQEVLSQKQILLVEDHPLNAEVAKRLLDKMGCKIVWAQDGQLAVEEFSRSAVHFFDAVLMDIRMPVMDGLESARAIRALKRSDAKTVPILAMTANAYEEDIRNSLNAGMNDHLAKPIEPERLYKALAHHIQHAEEQRDFYSYALDSAAVHISEVSIRTLKDLVQSILTPHGAYSVEYEAFHHIYEFLSRNITRLQQSTQMVLFTISKTKMTDGLYQELAEAIQYSLRIGDLMMEFNDRQLVALLLNCDKENGEIVAERIMHALRQKDAEGGKAVCFEISSIQGDESADKL